MKTLFEKHKENVLITDVDEKYKIYFGSRILVEIWDGAFHKTTHTM